jgi:alpha-amylase
MIRALRAALLSSWLLVTGVQAAAPFAANPIVYFVITDRFQNGNPANDQSYGRQPNDPDNPASPGAFRGGDLAGITQKLRAGYFQQLGVNALWITAPFEQIHGWVVGGSSSFRHYAYHGYWTLDYTKLDANMGTPDELREMIDTAHAQGIRVLFDVVMNHPGYADLQSLADTGVKVLWPGWQKATLRDYHSYIDYNNFAFGDWWGRDWVRAGLPGYSDPGRDDFTMSLAYLPDFKTEQAAPVALPPFLQHKADTRARTLPATPVRGYLVAWLSDWVREYGVDGFRADTVKHVEPDSWRALKTAAGSALVDWKARHPTGKIDDAPFWMTGEVWGHGPERGSWHDAGFDSLINFDLQARASGDDAAVDALFHDYAAALATLPAHDALSYISSHDTLLYPRADLKKGLTTLLLTPGGVQIFYGDESGRHPGSAPAGDPQQATRSPMNWDSADAALLAHAGKLGRFRAAHVAIARGQHQRLSLQPWVFARVDDSRDDRVVIAPALSGKVTLPLHGVFADGTRLRDAYSGALLTVAHGSVTLLATGCVLLERVAPLPAQPG